MNIFILNSGRCGSTTFIRACRHISNYSSAHESRVRLVGDDRLVYADNHIEADNRLSWLLGRLETAYGDEAFYVHLLRSPAAIVESFVKRADFGIMKAYREGVLLHENNDISNIDIAADYLHTVTANIEFFLKDKPQQMQFHLETAEQDFVSFWNAIEAQGDQTKALLEWGKIYNAS